MSDVSDNQNARSALITDWFRRTRESQHVHYACGDYFNRRHLWLGIPAIALSAVVGTAVFASLATEATVWVKVVVGLTSIAAAVLASLQTFLGYSDRSEKHKVAGAGYSSIRRKLELIKTFPPSSDEEWESKLHEIRAEMDDLARSAPEVPGAVHKREIKSLKSRGHDRLFALPPEGRTKAT